MTNRRREEARARSAAAHDGSTLRWPGATAKFALFGEVLWVGILCCVAGVALITLPAACAAGSAHLRRFLLAETAPPKKFFKDFLAALRTGWLVGVVSVLAIAILLVNIVIANSRLLPGWQFILAGGVLVLVALLVSLTGMTARWQHSRSWRAAGRSWLQDARADPPGVVWLLVAVILAVLAVWQLTPLVVPGIGCLVFAALTTAVRERAQRS